MWLKAETDSRRPCFNHVNWLASSPWGRLKARSCFAELCLQKQINSLEREADSGCCCRVRAKLICDGRGISRTACTLAPIMAWARLGID